MTEEYIISMYENVEKRFKFSLHLNYTRKQGKTQIYKQIHLYQKIRFISL